MFVVVWAHGNIKNDLIKLTPVRTVDAPYFFVFSYLWDYLRTGVHCIMKISKVIILSTTIRIYK